MKELQGKVIAVCRKAEPGLPKPQVETVHLIEDWGVEGDYHAGKLVRHRYLAKKYPTRRNKRQVLIVDGQTFEELKQEDIQIGPGMMGENISVAGLPIMQLPIGTQVTIGEALLEVTEVRTPCEQLNGIDSQLLKAVTEQKNGQKAYKAGIMTRVLKGGWVKAGDTVTAIITASVG